MILGRHPEAWQGGRARNVAFGVSEACQLRCRYCYVVGKSPRRMPFEIARRTIEYLLGHRAVFAERAVTWEFGIGEPLLEIELIDQISDHLKRRLFELQHPWFDHYRFNLSTNGLLYDDARVQRYIEKNRAHLSVGFSLDGTREKHDRQRVYPDGRGSYDDVVRNVPLWLEQFPEAHTKATLGSGDLPYVKESVLHLWSLGIKTVMMNVVFEEVWQEGDDELFEDQLRQLADHILEHDLYTRYNCTLFSDDIGHPLDPLRDNGNWCGAGQMLVVDAHGDFYPCHHFLRPSLVKRPPLVIGNCFTGLDFNRLRPFVALNRVVQSPPECVECEVASGCAYCKGLDYDESDTGTLYQRATYICKLHKAQVRANQYYREQFRARLGTEPTTRPEDALCP